MYFLIKYTNLHRRNEVVFLNVQTVETNIRKHFSQNILKKMIRRSLPEKGLYTIHLCIFLRYKENENCIKKNLLIDIKNKPFLFLQCTQRSSSLGFTREKKLIVHSTSFKERKKLKSLNLRKKKNKFFFPFREKRKRKILLFSFQKV